MNDSPLLHVTAPRTRPVPAAAGRGSSIITAAISIGVLGLTIVAAWTMVGPAA